MKLSFVLAVGIVTNPIQVEIADYLRRQQQTAIESHHGSSSHLEPNFFKIYTVVDEMVVITKSECIYFKDWIWKGVGCNPTLPLLVLIGFFGLVLRGNRWIKTWGSKWGWAPMWLRSLGSNYTWWGACFAGDVLRIDEYLQNGQDRTCIFGGVFLQGGTRGGKVAMAIG